MRAPRFFIRACPRASGRRRSNDGSTRSPRPELSAMSPFVAEIVGTALLILLGNGVVAGVLLARSKAQGAGWMVITTGWALAVFVGAYSVAAISGAHLNPAVTVGLAAAGKFEWAKVLVYASAQLIGAMVGSTLVWLHYMPHWAHTEDPNLKLAVFCTGPAVRQHGWNL